MRGRQLFLSLLKHLRGLILAFLMLIAYGIFIALPISVVLLVIMMASARQVCDLCFFAYAIQSYILTIIVTLPIFLFFVWRRQRRKSQHTETA